MLRTLQDWGLWGKWSSIEGTPGEKRSLLGTGEESKSTPAAPVQSIQIDESKEIHCAPPIDHSKLHDILLNARCGLLYYCADGKTVLRNNINHWPYGIDEDTLSAAIRQGKELHPIDETKFRSSEEGKGPAAKWRLAKAIEFKLAKLESVMARQQPSQTP